MFSPNPPRSTSQLQVDVTMADGQVRTWKFQPDRSPLGSFNWDRWRKFKEQLIKTEKLRANFAQWVVTDLTRPSEKAAKVEIILFTATLPPPGTDEPVKTEATVIYSQTMVQS